MYRLLFSSSMLLWVAAMTALFMRDVWPAWTAQDPPILTGQQFAEMELRQQQFGLFGSQSERIGTAWSEVVSAGGNTSIRGTLLIRGIAIVPEVRVETMTEFDDEGGLDSFSLDVHGVPMTNIRVRGERRGIYFPCELKIGPLHRQANLDLSASRMIGDTLKPFTYLPTLHVGQSWRMQLLDPMSAVIRRKAEFTSIVATVVGRETIDHRGMQVACFVVETSPQQVRAWVDERGRVLRQQVDMPGLGRVTVEEEQFSEDARAVAVRRVPARNTGDDGGF